MSVRKRTPDYLTKKIKIDAGPQLARIVSHLDPSRSGSLEVTLLRDNGNIIGEDSQTFVVKCAMPFFGYTAYEYTGENTVKNGASSTDAFNDTQKSYGMWMVPPDIGVTVLVVFVDGNPDQGYWIGCIPEPFSNNMVPGIAASSAVDGSAEDMRKFDSKHLPVAEINKRANAKDNQQFDPEKIKKPVHPFANALLEQGLLADDTRGITSSSARREAPSMVFGISTPGPLDKTAGAKRGRVGTVNSQAQNFVSRLGGSQFIMDDGNDQFVRKTPASEGPPEYADVIEGEKGINSIPKDECVRIRTRTGHQVLLHNSEDLIYIGNARGTTWIEMSSNGKIDIYANDSISVHTEADLNFRADRDVNLEAGRNINFKAVDGRIRQEAGTDLEVIANQNIKLKMVNGSFEVDASKDTKITSGGNSDINSGGNHTETAAQIHMNGPTAATADLAADLEKLKTHLNPASNKSAAWPGNRYRVDDVESIMKRIPMHEPWPNHENLTPLASQPNKTDREQ